MEYQVCEWLAAYEETWSFVGLALDFLGVSLLGYDLIKIQIWQRTSAHDNRMALEHLASEYGGIASWSDEIQKNARWIQSREYERHHAEEETSYNTRQNIESIKDIANCVAGIAEHLAGVAALLEKKSSTELKAAKKSYYLSVIGITLIAIGFALQMIGTLPC